MPKAIDVDAASVNGAQMKRNRRGDALVVWTQDTSSGYVWMRRFIRGAWQTKATGVVHAMSTYPVPIQMVSELDADATAHLDAMNRMGPNPWPLSFSYGRAMQSAALKIWSQDIHANVAKAQAMVLERARDNGLAALGRWSKAA